MINGEIKKITYKGYDFAYKVSWDETLGQLGEKCVTVQVVGGPKRERVTTTCELKNVKSVLMDCIKAIGPKKLGKRTREQELALIKRTRPR